MKKIIKKFKINNVLFSIVLIAIVLNTFLYLYIPKTIETSLNKNIVNNSILIAKRLQLQREYYINSVVNDIQKYSKNISFSYDHNGTNGILPFPTTLIHDLSKIYSKNSDVKISLYSNYPFLNRKDRVLSAFQKKALIKVQNSKNGVYYEKDIINNEEVLRVAVTDKMTLKECVTCHNNHSLKDWEFKWKLGDNRGILEIITPIKSVLGDINNARNNIVITTIILMFCLILYYTFLLLKRETQLKKEKKDLSDIYDNTLSNQSRHAQMGEMIANIAHQWRQPLSIITTATSSMLLQKDMNILSDKKFNQLCENIIDNSNYLSNTIDDFRGFIKGNKVKEKFELSDNIYKFLHLIESSTKFNNVNVILNLEKKIYITSYPNELIQCLINICNNSIDVLKNLDIKHRNIFITTQKINNNVIIKIKDSGGGIKHDILEKIFDPYFTTKHQSKGTGLGLNMTYKIVTEKMKGSLVCENNVFEHKNIKYKGALFIITIPTDCEFSPK